MGGKNRNRKVELKKIFIFIALKDKAIRTVKIKARDYEEAEAKAIEKYPSWLVSPYPDK
jgi:hypothetical protein